MQIQNKYIGDDKFSKMLEHYNCSMPLDVIKMRIAGAICSPNADLRPVDVISSLWEENKSPRLQTKEEADLFFKFFMGLWDEMFGLININKLKLPKLDANNQEKYCVSRFEEIELGFLEGFWGGKDDYKLPAFIAQVLDNLSDLALAYQNILKKVNKGDDKKAIKEVLYNTDRLVEKTISFIVDNQVLPNIEKLKRSVN